MFRSPEHCPHRVRHNDAPSGGHSHCELVRLNCELPESARCWVTHGACVACCAEEQPPEASCSQVIASMMLEQLSSPARSTDWTELRRKELMDEAIQRLATVPGDPSAAGSYSKILWAVGMLTAPRKNETLTKSLTSLKQAGFEDVQLFAEPGVVVPDVFQHLPITRNGRSLGVFGNTMAALSSLYLSQPTATAYALFQDDITVAAGLKAWCEDEFWPSGCGLVSLFTIREQIEETPGWQIARRGFYRTYGAMGFVFRRDVLLEFLSDHRVWSHRLTRAHGSDAAIGEWAARSGHGIAHYSPSLIQHRGKTSTIGHVFDEIEQADAIDDVADIPTWTRPPRKPGRVGLVGWNTASGLGYVNRELATHFSIDRWLAPQHSRFATLEPLPNCRMDLVPNKIPPSQIRNWLSGLEWVLFAELPYLDRMAQLARNQAIRVACIPMWEWLHPQLEWVKYVDLMLAPTRFTYERLTEWKKRYGFCWDVVELPWPVDATRFAFQQRTTCERFLFVNGTGGGRGIRPDGNQTEYRRKGAELMAETARLLPDIPFVWYSQTDDLPPLPPNVERRPSPEDSTRLYEVGDVCVQPSSWEGIGLQLLECQAAGMPLVTTDAAPMNEFRPLRTVPARLIEPVRVYGPDPILSHAVSPEDLAATLRQLIGTDLSEASRAARRFVEEQHSWAQAVSILKEHLIH